MPSLVVIAGAYAAGVTAGAILGGEWWMTAAVATCLALAAFAYSPRPHHAAVLLAAVLLAGAGHARIIELDTAPPPPLAALEGEREVIGVVSGDPSRRGQFTRLDLDVETVDGNIEAGRVRITLPSPLEPYERGDRLRLIGVVEPPPALEDFDYAAYLRARDVHAVIAFPREVERLGRAGLGWRDPLLRVRAWGLANIERSLPDPAAALAAGVLIGEQRALPPRAVEDLRVTGTTHLVVVSGQNVALLLGITIAALTTVLSRRRAALVALALLPPYLVIVGLDPPVLRGSLMAVALVQASVTGRRTPGWVALVYAIAAMLAFDPALVDDVAFQLSATATAGVMLIAPVLRDVALARLGWTEAAGRLALVEVAATATGAALAVVPVQAATFGYVSLWSVPANIVVAPLYEGSVLIAALAALLGWWPPAAEALALGGRAVPEAFLGAVSLMARLPHASLPVSAPLPAGVAYFACLIAATWWLQRRTGPPVALTEGRRTGLEWTVALALIAAAGWAAVLAPRDDLARITILDVGHGSAAVIQDGDATVLVDTGPPDGAVIAALHRSGVTSGVEAVILSHPDTDHAGGLYPLLQRMPVDTLLAPQQTLDALTFTHGAPLTIGDRIRLGDRVTIEVLAPPSHTRDRRHASSNDGSLVLMVTVGERRFLLPGDIEEGAEDWLVRSGQLLDADVLVLPHQGSRTSSTQPFVDAVSPAIAIASVGAGNPFGHPHEEVLARYAGTLLLRTDEDGDITLRTDGTRIWLSTSR